MCARSGWVGFNSRRVIGVLLLLLHTRHTRHTTATKIHIARHHVTTQQRTPLPLLAPLLRAARRHGGEPDLELQRIVAGPHALGRLLGEVGLARLPAQLRDGLEELLFLDFEQRQLALLAIVFFCFSFWEGQTRFG